MYNENVIPLKTMYNIITLSFNIFLEKKMYNGSVILLYISFFQEQNQNVIMLQIIKQNHIHIKVEDTQNTKLFDIYSQE